MKRTSLRYYAYKSGGALLALALLALLMAGVPAQGPGSRRPFRPGPAGRAASPRGSGQQSAALPGPRHRDRPAAEPRPDLQRYTRSQRRLGITRPGLSTTCWPRRRSRRGQQERRRDTSSRARPRTCSPWLQLPAAPPYRRQPLGGLRATSAPRTTPPCGQPVLLVGPHFAYIQPLLRNFGRLVTEREIIVAAPTARSAARSSRAGDPDHPAGGERLLGPGGAREQLGVAQQSLALARELHDRNRIQVEVGTLAPLELVQSEAAIATREEDIIRATAAVGDAEDELRRLLNLPPGRLWETPSSPRPEPEIERGSPSTSTRRSARPWPSGPSCAPRSSSSSRPGSSRWSSAASSSRSSTCGVDYGYNGAAPGAFRRRPRPDHRLRLPRAGRPISTSPIPIQNRAARAQSAIANLEVDRTRIEFEDQQSVVSTEVRRAARAVETAAKQIDAARISRQFQERNLDAERKRYENGLSTSFQITQIQEDLTLARSREVTARITYRTALAEYYRVDRPAARAGGGRHRRPRGASPTSRCRFRLRRDPLFGEDSGRAWE